MSDCFLMKSISVSDELYSKLKSIKGNRTYNQLLEDLLSRDVETRINMLIEVAQKTEYAKELDEIARKIRANFMVQREIGIKYEYEEIIRNLPDEEPYPDEIAAIESDEEYVDGNELFKVLRRRDECSEDNPESEK